MAEMGERVVLDGVSFVEAWPLELAGSMLAAPIPWWGSWPGDPTDEPNRGPEFARLANCVYGYCRYPKRVHLLSDLLVRNPQVSVASTQELLDALYFELRLEHFGYGHIRHHEPQMRRALQEVVRRVRSARPPTLLAVTRLLLELLHGDERVGMLTHYARGPHWISCRFDADPAFPEVSPHFEEAHEVTRGWQEGGDGEEWRRAYEKVDALQLSLRRADGRRGELNSIRIHGSTATLRLRQPAMC